jgi:ribosomal protein S8
MKNYVWGMFSTIKNAQLAKKAIALCKKTKVCENYLKLLWEEGLIIGYKYVNKNMLKIFLKYINSQPVIYSLKAVYKPSHKIYYSIKKIWKINSNKSLIIFSTNKGLKSSLSCKKFNLGGKLVLIIN